MDDVFGRFPERGPSVRHDRPRRSKCFNVDAKSLKLSIERSNRFCLLFHFEFKIVLLFDCPSLRAVRLWYFSTAFLRRVNPLNNGLLGIPQSFFAARTVGHAANQIWNDCDIAAAVLA